MGVAAAIPEAGPPLNSNGLAGDVDDEDAGSGDTDIDAAGTKDTDELFLTLRQS